VSSGTRTILSATLAGLLAGCRAAAPPDETNGMTAEERAYLGEIEISEATVSAAQNFLGDMVISLDANITNRGSRPVRQVELELTFVDPWGQVVLEEKGWPVSRRAPALAAGETRSFQLAFENMPVEWNQAPPRVAVRRVEF
jgi:hypothetical protein